MNTLLMEIYDEYQKTKTINKLLDFTKITLPSDGTDKLFIGCVLILINATFKNNLNTATLLTVVKSAKEKVGDTNLLHFYIDRVNSDKLVSKYLVKELKNPDFEKHVDLVIDYLESRSYDFTNSIKKFYQQKLSEYSEKDK